MVPVSASRKKAGTTRVVAAGTTPRTASTGRSHKYVYAKRFHRLHYL